MRNLKRALSLALASVMLLGMMVVGASAASYPDVDANDNVEAIEVLKAVGAMKGDNYGKFNPDDVVTRNEMATVIARLLLGEEAETYVGVHPFTDVPSWADKYVAACYDRGIVKGTSATTYNGTATVTAQEAATMMLRVLGYEQIAGTGADWARPVVATANQIRLFSGVTGSATAPLTRNQVAQLSLNALEADLVDMVSTPVFDGNAFVPQNKYEARKDLNNVNNKPYDYTNDGSAATHQKEYLQLLENLYDGKLIKDTKDYDDFDRPATTWKYKGKVIGTYMNTPDLVYTKAVELGDIYKDLSLGKALAADKVAFSVNGQDKESVTGTSDYRLAKGVDDEIGKNGVLTQVWYHSETETADITMIDTYVGKIGSVVKATSSADRYVRLINTSLTNYNDVVNDKFETENFESGDLVIFTMAWNGKRYDLKTVEPLEKTTTALLTKWEGKNKVLEDEVKASSDANFTAGETYKYSKNNMIVDGEGNVTEDGIASFDVDKSEVNVYLDKYGYAIYVSGIEGETNYAAVIGMGSSNTHGSETRGVTLLLPDGTQKAVTAKMDTEDWAQMSKQPDKLDDGSDNPDAKKNLVTDGIADIVTYSVGSDGVYKLSLVGPNKEKDPDTWTGIYDDNDKAVSEETTFLNGKSLMNIDTGDKDKDGNAVVNTYYTTSKTIFMVATYKKSGDATKGYNYNVYTGYANAPSIDITDDGKNNYLEGVAFGLNKQYPSQIDIVYIAAEHMAGVSGAETYFVKDGSTIKTTSDGEYYILPAVVEGKITEIKISAATKADWTGKGDGTLKDADKGLYAIDNVIKNKNGIITSCTLVNDTVFEAANKEPTGTVKANKIVLGIGTKKDGDGNVTDAKVWWAYNEDTTVYYVNEDWEINVIDISEVQTDTNDWVYAAHDGSKDEKKLTDVFIIERPAPIEEEEDGPEAEDVAAAIQQGDASGEYTIYVPKGSKKLTLDQIADIVAEELGKDANSIGVKSDGNGAYTVTDGRHEYAVTIDDTQDQAVVNGVAVVNEIAEKLENEIKKNDDLEGVTVETDGNGIAITAEGDDAAAAAVKAVEEILKTLHAKGATKITIDDNDLIWKDGEFQPDDADSASVYADKEEDEEEESIAEIIAGMAAEDEIELETDIGTIKLTVTVKEADKDSDEKPSTPPAEGGDGK